MKERPILFSAPMVRALLAGSKTQTRRVMKPQPMRGAPISVSAWEPGIEVFSPGELGLYREGSPPGTWGLESVLLCPYGQPGDRLWVRETFAIEHQVEHDQNPPHADGRPIKHDDEIGWHQPHYIASDAAPELCYDGDGEPTVLWKPSIHMPRWASRITLEVTGVRVERLQDISEADAKTEGLKAITKDNGHTVKYGIPDRDGLPGNDDAGWHWSEWCTSPVAAYRKLWEQINGPGSWDANPWVWVVEFKRATGGQA